VEIVHAPFTAFESYMCGVKLADPIETRVIEGILKWNTSGGFEKSTDQVCSQRQARNKRVVIRMVKSNL
jgi:hypothetical protein